jgi:hypothetical protein
VERDDQGRQLARHRRDDAGQLGYTPVAEPVTPAEFRRRVERAMVSAFGSGPVDTTPDKHIGVAAGTAVRR